MASSVSISTSLFHDEIEYILGGVNVKQQGNMDLPT